DWVIADLSARELHTARVRYQQDRPRHECRERYWQRRIGVEIDPGLDLPKLLPPGVIQQNRCRPACADEDHEEKDEYADEPEAETATGRMMMASASDDVWVPAEIRIA